MAATKTRSKSGSKRSHSKKGGGAGSSTRGGSPVTHQMTAASGELREIAAQLSRLHNTVTAAIVQREKLPSAQWQLARNGKHVMHAGRPAAKGAGQGGGANPGT